MVIRLNSSTSASERARRWRDWAVFGAVCLSLFVPYELLVRHSEKIYGKERAFFSGTLSKIDALHHLARRRTDLDVLVVGTSLAELGVDPRLLRSVLEPGSSRPVFNASLGGVSSLVGIRLAQDFGFHPRWLIVAVSPMDFTRLAQSRGDRFRRRAQDLAHPEESSHDIREVIDHAMGVALQSIFHGMSPLRRRTAGDWLRFARAGDVDVFAFLNSEAILDQCETCWDGYTGAIVERNTTDRAYFAGNGVIDVGTTAGEYNADHATYVEQLERQLVPLRDAGVRVVMVRIDEPLGFRIAEDAQTVKFRETMLELSARTNIPYIDDLMPAEFLRNPENFIDTKHLSYGGSRAYTQRLAQQIRSLNMVAQEGHSLPTPR